MPRDLILGTAGHIDHGKTSLVKALTGIDCDRLPEEKARGITIDIGFATLDLGDFRLGIVDVPGHERFIKNMLAGATGIDLAVLVVAADDSVMPQTREHLEILKLLGLRHGVIALTKCDLVDETTREVVELESAIWCRARFLADAPIVPTSATPATGIAELKAAIAVPRVRAGRGRDARTSWFRLAIDRSFIVQGHGTVVTGSVTSGSVQVGDEVDWLPRGERVRVRSLQNHDQPVEEVHRGMRAAINLAGVAHEDVIRGQELATPGYLVPATCDRSAALPGRRATADQAPHARPLPHRHRRSHGHGLAARLRHDRRPAVGAGASCFSKSRRRRSGASRSSCASRPAQTTLGGGQCPAAGRPQNSPPASGIHRACGAVGRRCACNLRGDSRLVSRAKRIRRD